MNDQLSKIDHLAIVVENIEESVEYYSTKFNCEVKHKDATWAMLKFCLLYTSPSPRDATLSRMPSSA